MTADIRDALEPPTMVNEPEFFAIDVGQITLREFAFGTPWPLMPIAMLVKYCRLPAGGPPDDPPLPSLRPWEAADLPVEVAQRFEPLITGLRSLGFAEPVIFHRVTEPILYHGRKNESPASVIRFLVTLIHGSGQAIARIHERTSFAVHPPKQNRFVEIITGFADGAFLSTSSAKPDLLSPPACRVQRIIKGTPQALWQLHQNTLATTTQPIFRVTDADAARDLTEAHHATVRNFHVARGVFVPLPADATVKMPSTAIPAAPPDFDPAQAAIYQRMLSEQTRRGNVMTMLLILAVSLGVFLAAGAIAWSWGFLGMVVLILFIHEAGHFVTMKAFGYRDLKMFFLPLLGAAVSGRPSQVAGWKQAIVALMGPLPGIAVGLLTGLAGVVLHHAWLLEFALLSLLINGLNLLPFLPLDGGRVVQMVLFSRHRFLDTGFRIIAVCALAGVYILTNDRIFLFLTIVMMVSLPLSYRLAKITDALRKSGAAVPPDDPPPPELARTIIDQLRPKRIALFSGAQTTRQIAKQAVQVLDTLSAKPPGVFASITLLLLHGGLFLSALLISGLLLVAQNPDLSAMFQGAMRTADFTPLDPDTFRLAVGNASNTAQDTTGDPSASKPVTLIARWPNASAAPFFDQMQSELADGATMLLLGQSLLIQLPADKSDLRQQWIERLQASNAIVAVHSNAGFTQPLSLTCLARNHAEANAIQAYFQNSINTLGGARLIPPWTPDDARTEEQCAQHEQARRTVVQMNQALMNVWADPAIQEFAVRIGQAYRLGDAEKINALQQEQITATQALIHDRFVELGQRDDLHPQVLAMESLFIRTRFAGDDHLNEEELSSQVIEARHAQIQQQFRPLENLLGTTDDHRYTVQNGFAQRDGLLITFQVLSFDQPINGIPAFVHWLQDQHCIQFRYQWGGLLDDWAVGLPGGPMSD
jgi:Zn-dependent protease